MSNLSSDFTRWQALALVYAPVLRILLAVVLALSGTFGMRLFRGIFQRLHRIFGRHMPKWLDILFEGFLTPCTLLCRSVIWYAAVYVFPWPASWAAGLFFAADKLLRIAAIVLIGCGFWNASPMCGLLLKTAQNELDLESNRTMQRFFERVYRVAVAVLALIAVVGEFTDVTALITGAGLVGLTISLAAQNAVADLVAGISLVLEHPFGLGDWIVAGDVEGSVEDISFRSTKIRTIENALVTVKNSSIYAANIQNVADRKSRLWAFTISVRYDTSAGRLKALCDALRELFLADDEVLPDTLEINVSELAESGINIELRCYVTTVGIAPYRRLKNRLQLAILELVRAQGCDFAFPSTSVYLEGDAPQKS